MESVISSGANLSIGPALAILFVIGFCCTAICIVLGIMKLIDKVKIKNVIVIVNENDSVKIEEAYQDFINRKIGAGEYAHKSYSEKDAFKMAARKLLSE